MEEFPASHGDIVGDEYTFSSPDRQSVRDDYPDVRGHATACVIDLKGSWEEHLPLVEFSYNNNYKASIQMELYEALYGRSCQSLVCWTKLGRRTTTGSKLVRDTFKKVDLIRKRLLMD